MKWVSRERVTRNFVSWGQPYAHRNSHTHERTHNPKRTGLEIGTCASFCIDKITINFTRNCHRRRRRNKKYGVDTVCSNRNHLAVSSTVYKLWKDESQNKMTDWQIKKNKKQNLMPWQEEVYLNISLFASLVVASRLFYFLFCLLFGFSSLSSPLSSMTFV